MKAIFFESDDHAGAASQSTLGATKSTRRVRVS